MSIVRLATKRPKLFFENQLSKYTIQLFLFSDGVKKDLLVDNKQLGGFAQSYDKFAAIKDSKEPSKTFSALLRYSPFIDLGDPTGKVVIGTIFHIVDNDLYIDFGWKFHCVCSKPIKNPNNYVRGAKVKLRIRELELSSKFLGYEKDLTLLEADCTLLGLVQEKSGSTQEK